MTEGYTTTIMSNPPASAAISLLPRATRRSSDSSAPTGHVVGIGVGFVGCAIAVITLSVLSRLFIVRRRAREENLPRPRFWDVFFENADQFRHPGAPSEYVGFGLGGGWSFMGWDAGGGRGGGGRRLDGGGKSVKVPQITSIEVPSDGQMMVPDWSNYQPLSLSCPLKSTNNSSPSEGLALGSVIETAVVILYPSASTVIPLDTLFNEPRELKSNRIESLEHLDYYQSSTTDKKSTPPLTTVSIRSSSPDIPETSQPRPPDRNGPVELPEFVVGVHLSQAI